MVPDIIKYVSVDKLVRFEEWTNREVHPEPILRRIAVSCARVNFNYDPVVPMPQPTRLREYELFRQYVNPANGKAIWEYRERL